MPCKLGLNEELQLDRLLLDSSRITDEQSQDVYVYVQLA